MTFEPLFALQTNDERRSSAVAPAANTAPASDPSSLKTEIIWGAKAIGQEINRSERQASYLLENGQLPAKKVGGRWCSTRTALRGFFNFNPAGEGA